jgi:UMF1 family MFS transporter
MDAIPAKSEPVSRKALIGWVVYDWANSAFALTVVMTFFPVFFKQVLCGSVDPTLSTARLGVANSVAGVVIMFLSPLLGAVADRRQRRKSFLGVSMLLGVLASATLAGISQHGWVTAIVVFVIANVGFECSVLFYDSLLPQITTPEKMDFISSLGYAMGYVGCAVLFIFNIVMVTKPALFGLANSGEAIRWSFVSVALWWFLFSLPLLLFVRERPGSETSAVSESSSSLFAELWGIAKQIARTPHILLFLIAYWLYIDGMHTFIRMASDFGMSIGLPATGLMKSIFLVQLIAFPSALIYGWLAHKFGALPCILSGIGLYIFICVAAPIAIHTPKSYTFFALLTGIPLGCLQALSRSYYAKLIPQDSSATYFGFYNLLGRAAVILGPLMVGVVAILFRHHGASADLAARAGMSSLVIFFVGGAISLVLAERARRRTL